MKYKPIDTFSNIIQEKLEADSLGIVDTNIQSDEQLVYDLLNKGSPNNFRRAVYLATNLLDHSDFSFFQDGIITTKIFSQTPSSDFEYTLLFFSRLLEKRILAQSILQFIPSLPDFIKNIFHNPPTSTSFVLSIRALCNLSIYTDCSVFSDVSIIQKVFSSFLISIDNSNESLARECLDFSNCYLINMLPTNEISQQAFEAILQYVETCLKTPLKESAIHSVAIICSAGLSQSLISKPFIINTTSSAALSGNSDAQNAIVYMARDIPGTLFDTGFFDFDIGGSATTAIITALRFEMRGEGTLLSTIQSTMLQSCILNYDGLCFETKIHLASLIGEILSNNGIITEALIQTIQKWNGMNCIFELIVIGFGNSHVLPECFFAMLNLVKQINSKDIIDSSMIIEEIEEVYDGLPTKLQVICNEILDVLRENSN